MRLCVPLRHKHTASNTSTAEVSPSTQRGEAGKLQKSTLLGWRGRLGTRRGPCGSARASCPCRQGYSTALCCGNCLCFILLRSPHGILCESNKKETPLGNKYTTSFSCWPTGSKLYFIVFAKLCTQAHDTVGVLQWGPGDTPRGCALQCCSFRTQGNSSATVVALQGMHGFYWHRLYSIRYSG